MASILASFWLWDVYNRAVVSREMKSHLPLAPLDTPKFSPGDVSILIMTIDTPSEFANNIRLFLANKPKEIIIVTIPRDLELVQKLVLPIAKNSLIPISIFTVPKPAKRIQMALAIEKANGAVLCFADDDTVWKSENILPYLLAGFEGHNVGGVVGRQSPMIPDERRNPSIITPWEVAIMRLLSKNDDNQFHRYLTCDTVWTLIGRTALVRADALKSGSFIHDLTHEIWGGQAINTGEDSFMTHWLRTKGWRLCFQEAPEAIVYTDVKRDSQLLKQLIRWQRSIFQALIFELFIDPGFFTLYQKNPRLARRLAEALSQPVITLIHLIGWINCIHQTPFIALVFALWYFFQMIHEQITFFRAHSWIGLRNLWASVAIDQAYLILDYYGLFTVQTEAWLTRRDK